MLFVAFASAEESGKEQGQRRGPPPQALEACEAGVEGDSCSFENRRGETLTGNCGMNRDEVLSCRPEGGGRHGGLHRRDGEKPADDGDTDG
jgi:hypothetical protein